jgi:hypothetical protein
VGNTVDEDEPLLLEIFLKMGAGKLLQPFNQKDIESLSPVIITDRELSAKSPAVLQTCLRIG